MQTQKWNMRKDKRGERRSSGSLRPRAARKIYSTARRPGFKEPVSRLHTNIAESHQWKPNPYVRRGPRQGVLFMPKPSTTPLSSYFTTKIATGKRCADDFDCMRVLGQVCKRGKRASTGNCQCPESTPVHLTDEAQPRCVAARHIFEECADSVECSFLNPHVECFNQVCTCRPPNVLKRNNICVPAGFTSKAASAIAWIAGVLILVGVVCGTIICLRKLVDRYTKDDCMGPTYHSQYWREDRPTIWDSTKAMVSEMRDKVRNLARRHRDNDAPMVQETRVHYPSQIKINSRRVRHTTVQVDVHRSVSPEEDARDMRTSFLLPPEERPDQNDKADLSPTSRDFMLKEDPSDCQGTPIPSVQHAEHVDNASAVARSEAVKQSRDARIITTDQARASGQHVFDSDSDAERIMKMVLHQLGMERSTLVQKSASEAAMEPASRKAVDVKPAGGGPFSSDLSDCREETVVVDALPISGIARSIYSNTLLALRNKLLSRGGQSSDNVDDVSYGDSCKPSEEKESVEKSADLFLDGGLSHIDKGGGEDKTKVSSDVPTWRRAPSPAKDNAASRETLFSVRQQQAPRKANAFCSETMSEQKNMPPLTEASLLGSRFDTVVDSYKSFACPVDAYPVMQNWTRPQRTYLLKDDDEGESPSYNSFSDTSRSRLWKTRKSAGAPSMYSQSAGRCGSDRKHSKASEKFGKPGDAFKSFVSSIYPHSTVPTSTRSAGCFRTACSEIPQQRSRGEQRRENVDGPLETRKNARVHYYDGKHEHGENPKSSGGPGLIILPDKAPRQAAEKVGQSGSIGTITKKRSILKNAGSNLDQKRNAKGIPKLEEQKPLLLKGAQKSLINSGQAKQASSALNQRVPAAQQKVEPMMKLMCKINNASVIRNPACTDDFTSISIDLEDKTRVQRSPNTSLSKTSKHARPSSECSKTRNKNSSGSPDSFKEKRRSSADPSRSDRYKPVQVKSSAVPECGIEVKTLGCSHRSATVTFSDDEKPFLTTSSPRAALFNKLNLPFGVQIGDAKKQWGKSLDGQIGKMQGTTTHGLPVNVEGNIIKTKEAGRYATIPDVTTKLNLEGSNEYGRQQLPAADDEINFNITDEELIRCINKLVGFTPTGDQNDERQFPKTTAEQTPVSGHQLMQDTLLHGEAVSTEATDRKSIMMDVERCSSSHRDALNKPLASLRRGDLKDILKEIIEEEYSHLLHASAQLARECVTDTKTSDPFPGCEESNTDNSSESSTATLSRSSVRNAVTKRTAHTAPEGAVTPQESHSVNRTSTAHSSTGETSQQSYAKSSETEEDTTRGSSATRVTSTNDALASREITQSMVGNMIPDPAYGHATSFIRLTYGNKKELLVEQHLDAVSEDTSSDGYRLECGQPARLDVASNAIFSHTSDGTVQSSDVDLFSVEQGPVHDVLSDDRLGIRLLSDISIESSSTSKPPLVDEPSFVRFTGDHLTQPQDPLTQFVVSEEREQATAIVNPGKHRGSWSRPVYGTLQDAEAIMFSYTEEIVPLPEVKPSIEASVSASNASLAKSQEGLKPFPQSGLFNRSDSYVPFGNWSYNSHIQETDNAANGQPTSVGRCLLSVRAGDESEQELLRKVQVAQFPKAASFHGFFAKHSDNGATKTEAKQRTKSHTDYWLKTVSLFQEVTTDQMSSSGDTCTDASGTNTIFEPEQIEALERAKLRKEVLSQLPYQKDEVNPLLETFLRLQNEAYDSTPRPSTTCASDTHTGRTPSEVKNECIGSGAAFDTSFGDYSLLTRYLATCCPTVQCAAEVLCDVVQKDTLKSERHSADLEEPACCQLASPDQERRTRSRSPESYSPNVETGGNQASYEDSSTASFSEEKRVKMRRKTAPYRTPFPLCSSSRSTAAFRYNTKAIKKNWSQRMASAFVPTDAERDEDRTARFVAEQAHVSRPVRSETAALREREEDVPKRSPSAVVNPDAGSFWNYKSCQVQQWLNQAAQYFTNYEEGMPANPPQGTANEPAESSTSSEYYEAEPTTDAFLPSSQQGTTDDPSNWC
ncbi:microtubule-associated protein futsch-like isoform X2 [Dermacentor albipictus]|uniref:microtubule-associated protein futsch-like isoform X2 n=1 Tax=Dermacentor albipictus TaxID=60249 RepID=UPI0038FBF0FD